MPEVREWKPDFRYYEELVGIKCVRNRDVRRLMEALCSRDLRTCPQQIIADTIVIPKDAVRFLPLDGIKHEQIELRERASLTPEVGAEVHRRWFANSEKPHYYIAGRGDQRVCCKSFVRVSVIREIEGRQ